MCGTHIRTPKKDGIFHRVVDLYPRMEQITAPIHETYLGVLRHVLDNRLTLLLQDLRIKDELTVVLDHEYVGQSSILRQLNGLLVRPETSKVAIVSGYGVYEVEPEKGVPLNHGSNLIASIDSMRETDTVHVHDIS